MSLGAESSWGEEEREGRKERQVNGLKSRVESLQDSSEECVPFTVGTWEAFFVFVFVFSFCKRVT